MATPMETRWQLVPYFTITFNNHICFFISSWRLDCVKWKSLGLKLLLQLHWLVAVHRSKEVTPVFRYHDVIMTNGIHGENEAACERQRIHARLIPSFKTGARQAKITNRGRIIGSRERGVSRNEISKNWMSRSALCRSIRRWEEEGEKEEEEKEKMKGNATTTVTTMSAFVSVFHERPSKIKMPK